MSGGDIVVISGCMGAGKSSLLDKFQGYHRLNRDTLGGKLKDLADHLDAALAAGKDRCVLDNTFPTIESRKPLIEVARARGVPIRCMHLNTSSTEAQTNAALRMIAKYGRCLSPEEIAKASRNDPNTFPPIAIYSYFSKFERPTRREGFAEVETVRFRRRWDPTFDGKALLLDYDGTLRRTKSGRVCPHDPNDIEILPNRREKLLEYQAMGYRLLGISNQADIGFGRVAIEKVVECFEQTNQLLGLDIEYSFCPHRSRPVGCYCRKPGPGLVVSFVQKYRLNPKKCIIVGDMDSDRETAKNLKIKYFDQAEFFVA